MAPVKTEKQLLKEAAKLIQRYVDGNAAFGAGVGWLTLYAKYQAQHQREKKQLALWEREAR